MSHPEELKGGILASRVATGLVVVTTLVVGVYFGRRTAPPSSHDHSETSLHYDCDGCLVELQRMALRLNKSVAEGTTPRPRPQAPKIKKAPKAKAAGPEKPKKEGAP